jgi:group I intron endonuclease
MYCIYKHTSPSGKAYIGQTNNYLRRCSLHKTTTACPALANAIKIYGWDNFTHEILHDNLTLDQANKLEELCILEHNTLAPNGYNLRTGGLNSKPSAETKAKISKANKGKVFSESHRKKIGISNSKRIISKETREKMSLAKKGKVISQETRLKMSLANKGKIISNETRLKMSLAHKNEYSIKSQDSHNRNIFFKELDLYKINVKPLNKLTLTRSELCELLKMNKKVLLVRLRANKFKNAKVINNKWIISMEDIKNYYENNHYLL